MIDRKEELRLKRFANEIRRGILTGISSFGVGHVGGSLSIADVTAVLYGRQMHVDPKNPGWKDRDKLVISKGHAGPAQYAALALRGFFPLEELKTLNANRTNLPSHCDRIRTRGIDVSTGSLGQGASAAAGLALSDRMDGRTCRTYLIVGEGDLEEGQTWEAAMFTAHNRLTNLITIADLNGMQVDGRAADVAGLTDVAAKYRAFGFRVTEVADGNDIRQICEALDWAQEPSEQPAAVLLHTVKGAGLSRYAGRVECHFTEVPAGALEEDLRELDKIDAELDRWEAEACR